MTQPATRPSDTYSSRWQCREKHRIKACSRPVNHRSHPGLSNFSLVSLITPRRLPNYQKALSVFVNEYILCLNIKGSVPVFFLFVSPNDHQLIITLDLWCFFFQDTAVHKASAHHMSILQPPKIRFTHGPGIRYIYILASCGFWIYKVVSCFAVCFVCLFFFQRVVFV